MSKFFNICLKLLTVLLCHQVLTLNAAKTRIVGGIHTTINGRNRFIVSLRYNNGRFFCGGSLVNKNYVITAAHCVAHLQIYEFNVHGGVTYLSEVGQRRFVQAKYVPVDFDRFTKHMDVAVLRLSSPMEGPNVATIGMCGHELFVGDYVEVYGWGRIHENITGSTNELRTATIRLTSTTECKVKYPYLSETSMCASELGERDTCKGDSGGPLVHNGQLCGIVSYGRGCGRQDYEGVYININEVKEFINYAILY